MNGLDGLVIAKLQRELGRELTEEEREIAIRAHELGMILGKREGMSSNKK